MRRTTLFIMAGIVAMVVLLYIIWQVKSISGSAILKPNESVSEEAKFAYNSQCARCHGNSGQGFSEKPDIRDSGYSEAEIKEIIKNGLDQMPSFSNIPEPVLSELANYVSNF